MLKILRNITLVLLLVSVAAMGVIYYLASPIPDQEALSNIEQIRSSEVYDVNGSVMASFYSRDRYPVALSSISPYVIDALVATEDHRFYSHSGVDYLSLVRVALKSVIMGENAGGGSTITQQLAKNLMGRKQVELLYYPVNKTREMVMAGRLEEIYSKEEILELYLNTVPFGNRIYGIESASRAFFNKHAINLTLPEAATLVGMLKANTTYHPGLHPHSSTTRRNLVLSLMYDHKMIDQFELTEAETATLEVSGNWRKEDRSYLLTQVKKQATEIVEIYNSKEDVDLNIHTSGLKIYTTIDAGLQKEANKALQRHMISLQETFDQQWKEDFWERHPYILEAEIKKVAGGRSTEEMMQEREMTIYFGQDPEIKVWSPMDSLRYYLKQLQAGFVAVDPHSGGILAWVGGHNYQLFPYDHVDYSAKRQVGSVFKPVVYTAALEAGIDPCTYYTAEQVAYEVEEGEWNPRNSDGSYEGTLTMEDALEESVNTVSVKILESVGIERTIQMARQLGISSSIPEVLSIAVGTPSISLIEMVSAYAVFANEGYRIDPHLITRIEDVDGNVLYSREPTKQRVINKNTALEMTYFLKGVVDNGTASSLRGTYGLTNDLGGKTGTTQANADGWFMSISPRMVTGVWVGGAYPAIAFSSTREGQGATMALPVVGNLYRQINQQESYNSFTRARFAPLPQDVATALDCLPLEDDRNFFQRLFGKKTKDDKETADTTEKTGFFKKVKSIFKKKKKQAE